MNEISLSSRRIALAVYALAIPLAFPHEWPGGGSIDLGLAFVWLIPAALMIGIEGRSIRDAGRVVFLASLAGHAVLFHWFYVVTVTYGGMSPWLGLLSPLLPSLYVSIFSALCAMGLARIGSRGVRSVVLGAALWVMLDWMRAHFLGGFPWATLGYALHQDVPLMAITRWTGVYGLSFVAALGGLTLAQVYRTRSSEAIRRLALVAIAIAAAHGLSASTPSLEEGKTRLMRIAAIQGNVDQGVKWDAARRERILEKYLRLSESAVDQGAEWIVWPETAIPGFAELDPVLAERLPAFARDNQVALIAGGMGVAIDPQTRRIRAFFDSGFAFDRTGQFVDRYDKTHLVPFGEFVPFRAILGRFFEALATGLSTADVTAGSRPRVLRWTDPGGDGTPIRVAVPICYELLFPHDMRQFGSDGAGVMLAITNDAWYGRTGAPHQFLAMTEMRAAENGRWVVRAANTGISAIIDDRGRVRERSELFEDAFVVDDVPITLLQPPTFYARFGDVFASICSIVVMLAMGEILIGERRGMARDSDFEEDHEEDTAAVKAEVGEVREG